MVDDEAAGVTPDAGVSVRGMFVLTCCFVANGEDMGDWLPCFEKPLAEAGVVVVADGAILRCVLAQ